MIDLDKKYKTLAGNEVKIYAFIPELERIVGVVKCNNDSGDIWMINGWDPKGICERNSSRNLVEVNEELPESLFSDALFRTVILDELRVPYTLDSLTSLEKLREAIVSMSGEKVYKVSINGKLFKNLLIKTDNANLSPSLSQTGDFVSCILGMNFFVNNNLKENEITVVYIEEDLVYLKKVVFDEKK